MDFSRYRDQHRFSPWARPKRMRSAMALVIIVTCCGLTSHAWAQSDNPGYDRPGYGFTPVALDPGDVIIEQGMPDWSRDTQSGVTSSLYSADTLFRLGIGGPVELQVGSSPWNYLREYGAGPEQRFHGRGDSNLALKIALPSPSKNFTWGLLGSVEFTDGNAGLRNDERQYLLGSALNLQVTDDNAIGAYLEDVRSGGRNNTTFALSDNYNLTNKLTVYAEVARLLVAGEGNGVVAGGGVAWAITHHIQFDVGFDRRIAGTATQWQTNLGLSFYFGH